MLRQFAVRPVLPDQRPLQLTDGCVSCIEDVILL